jgi:hypothetical protein
METEGREGKGGDGAENGPGNVLNVPYKNLDKEFRVDTKLHKPV